MRVPLMFHDTLPSTMDAAHTLAAEGAPHGSTVVAVRQTAARGTRGRAWSAESGGLWLSLVARPGRTDALEALSLRVGLALADALERELSTLPPLGLKWPNDLLLDGRKVAGVLAEARWAGSRCQWVVIGVGVNVSNDTNAALGAGATSLAAVTAVPDATALAEPVAAAIAEIARDAGELTPRELESFVRRDVLRGRRATEPVEGVVEGITPAGALRIRVADGAVRSVTGGLVLAAT